MHRRSPAFGLILALLISCPAFAGNVHIGDSTANPGTGASVPANGYVPLLDAALGITATNLGHSGDQAADQSIASYGQTLGAADIAAIFMINDHWRYGTDATKRGYYQAFLTGIAVHLAAPTRVTARDACMTLTGTWTNSQPAWAVGKWSNVAGSTATTNPNCVSGTAVYIGTILQDASGSPVSGSANVIIDGIMAGTISSNGLGMGTQNGPQSVSCCYAPGKFRFGGLANISHTVEVQIVSGFVYLEDITGSAQAVKPKVYLSNVTRMTAAGYAALGNTSSDANVVTYGGVVSTLQANLAADGLNVFQVDSYTPFNPAVDTYTDGAHPNDAGYASIKTGFYSVITGGAPVQTFTTAPVYQRLINGTSDGTFWIDDGAARKQLTVQ